MAKILTLLGDAKLLAETSRAQELWRDFSVSHQIRITAAQSALEDIRKLLLSFEHAGGQIILCLCEQASALPAIVASLTQLPVLHISGEDGSPIRASACASFVSGVEGFFAAALFALKMLARQDVALGEELMRYQKTLQTRAFQADQEYQVNFHV